MAPRHRHCQARRQGQGNRVNTQVESKAPPASCGARCRVTGRRPFDPIFWSRLIAEASVHVLGDATAVGQRPKNWDQRASGSLPAEPCLFTRLPWGQGLARRSGRLAGSRSGGLQVPARLASATRSKVVVLR